MEMDVSCVPNSFIEVFFSLSGQNLDIFGFLILILLVDLF